MEKSCCFSGHRPQLLPWRFNEQSSGCLNLKRRLYEEILQAILEDDARHFLSGMALGVIYRERAARAIF